MLFYIRADEDSKTPKLADNEKLAELMDKLIEALQSKTWRIERRDIGPDVLVCYDAKIESIIGEYKLGYGCNPHSGHVNPKMEQVYGSEVRDIIFEINKYGVEVRLNTTNLSYFRDGYTQWKYTDPIKVSVKFFVSGLDIDMVTRFDHGDKPYYYDKPCTGHRDRMRCCICDRDVGHLCRRGNKIFGNFSPICECGTKMDWSEADVILHV